ncbi:MAG TPA: SDR family NAD(P)-dependent oxidoreductase [Acidimicrobiales bacterium]|nr:SDR family NAD(P)-dependent oxidoreductase [Acidimicrobiales bacterium]
MSAEGGEFRERVVVVTGAAHGIGQATAHRYAEEGARLVLADLDVAGAQLVAEECGGRGAQALAVGFDQRSSASVAEMVAAAHDRFGPVDVLANVAGIYPGAAITATTDEMWDDVVRNNLTGVFYCCRAVLPDMRERGGAIVSVASGAAVRPIEGMAAYAASKGGLAAFSRVLALEAAPLVRVNVVAPGPTATDGVRAAFSAGPAGADRAATGAGDGGTERSGLDASLLLERWGRPAEIADVIVFLTSDRASFVTGQMIHVNGGRSMM